MTPLPSRLPFASLVAYCPRGSGHAVEQSQKLMRQVKANSAILLGQETAAAFVARRLAEMRPAFVAEFLGPAVALVPVPRSSLLQPGGLWPALELARALRGEKLGRSVFESLRRERPVPKAAIAHAKERPKALAHFESLTVVEPMALPAEVTLVDDVITKGAQMMGAAMAIWAVRRDVTVRAFAVIRTISKPEEFIGIAAPTSGVITLRDAGDCIRRP